jgi:hypothetical protein
MKWLRLAATRARQRPREHRAVAIPAHGFGQIPATIDPVHDLQSAVLVAVQVGHELHELVDLVVEDAGSAARAVGRSSSSQAGADGTNRIRATHKSRSEVRGVRTAADRALGRLVARRSKPVP